MHLTRLATLVLCAAIATSLVQPLEAPTKPAPTIENKVWVERKPTSPRDMVHSLVLAEVRGKKYGVSQHSSRLKVRADVLTWSKKGDSLVLEFPQDKKRVKLNAKVRRCIGEAPKPFTLCLDLTDGKNRTLRLYSRKSWRPGSEESQVNVQLTEPPAVDVNRWSEGHLSGMLTPGHGMTGLGHAVSPRP
jgi:hypothetical protein